jgi:hypothetical protein
MVLYLTHGTNVWGHRFGFLKQAGICHRQMLNVSLPTFDERIVDSVGSIVIAEIIVDGQRFQRRMRLRSTVPLGGLHIVDLWLEHIGTGLREMLEAGQQAPVRIVGPASVVSRLDVRAEVFDLNGLTANALKAEEFCEDLPHDNAFRPVPRRRGNLYAANFASGTAH